MNFFRAVCWVPGAPVSPEVFESGAILMFLADKYGGLDTPEKRALAGKLTALLSLAQTFTYPVSYR